MTVIDWRSIAWRLRRWWRLRNEGAPAAFMRGRNEQVQKVSAAMVPLAEACRIAAQGGGHSPIRAGRRPGTLTVVVGNERVTLDPLDPTDKFLRDRAMVDRLLAKIAP